MKVQSTEEDLSEELILLAQGELEKRILAGEDRVPLMSFGKLLLKA
jgi:hypothetical protein